MEIEEEDTNNKEQLLNKVTLSEAHVVIDDGALLHQVFQVFGFRSTFKEATNKSRRYVSSKYKTCQIIFDGCKSKTTKECEDVKHITHRVPMF